MLGNIDLFTNSQQNIMQQQLKDQNIVSLHTGTYPSLIIDLLTLKDLFNTGLISKPVLLRFMLLLDYGNGLERLIDENNNIVWGKKHHKELFTRWFQYSDPEIGIKKISFTKDEICITISSLVTKLNLSVNSIQLIIDPVAYSEQLELNLEENENQD
jgi:hypothetical protein